MAPTLGIAAEIDRGTNEQATVRVEESMAVLRELGDLRGLAMCLTTLGMDALEQGDAGRAAEMFEEEDKVGIVYGLLGLAAVNTLRGRPATAVRLMGAAEALREAIGHPPLPPPAPDILTRRQRAVTALIERGFTNHQIATELFITERTVETHVSKILPKLGVHSRTQIATWVMEQG